MPKLVHTCDGKFLGEIDHPDCSIRVDDSTVSGKHALVTSNPSAYMEGLLDIHIEDQGSTNGTIINGKNIKRHMMKHKVCWIYTSRIREVRMAPLLMAKRLNAI